MTRSSRPTYTIQIRPEPGTDAARALHWALKVLLRKFRLRAISVREDDEYEPDTDSFYATDYPDGGCPDYDFEEGSR
jgi:hypothetical protein